MPTSLLEIVDLGNGEIVLRRADEGDERGANAGDNPGADSGANSSANSSADSRSKGGNEPLVTIRFSEESRMYIMDQGLEVAKAMIQAGIQAAAAVAEQAGVEVEAESTAAQTPPRSRILH